MCMAVELPLCCCIRNSRRSSWQVWLGECGSDPGHYVTGATGHFDQFSSVFSFIVKYCVNMFVGMYYHILISTHCEMLGLAIYMDTD